MDETLLSLLKQKKPYTQQHLADLLAVSIAEVQQALVELEQCGELAGFYPILTNIHDDKAVSAFIEVKLTPEREGGFDTLANRIAQFEYVDTCYLASGGFDLLVVVEGKSLQDVARFVTEKLSTIQGVLATATHFKLKTYKEHGVLFDQVGSRQRLLVAP